MALHKKKKKEEQVINLTLQVAQGENVLSVCHIFALHHSATPLSTSLIFLERKLPIM
jgi:hypothetical protein